MNPSILFPSRRSSIKKPITVDVVEKQDVLLECVFASAKVIWQKVGYWAEGVSSHQFKSFISLSGLFIDHTHKKLINGVPSPAVFLVCSDPVWNVWPLLKRWSLLLPAIGLYEGLLSLRNKFWFTRRFRLNFSRCWQTDIRKFFVKFKHYGLNKACFYLARSRVQICRSDVTRQAKMK